MKHQQYKRRDMLQKIGIVGGTLLVSGCGDEKTTAKEVSVERESVEKLDESPTVETLPDNLKESHFVVHNKNPLGLESRREMHTASPITPLQKLCAK